MSEPAMAEPNEVEVGADRLLRLRTTVGVGTYHLDGPDAAGAYRLIPATPWEELDVTVYGGEDRARRGLTLGL